MKNYHDTSIYGFLSKFTQTGKATVSRTVRIVFKGEPMKLSSYADFLAWALCFECFRAVLWLMWTILQW